MKKTNSNMKTAKEFLQLKDITANKYVHGLDLTFSELCELFDEYRSLPIEQEQRHQIELSNYAYQIDLAKRERDKAEQEVERLKGESAEDDHVILILQDQCKKLEAQLKEATKEQSKIAIDFFYWWHNQPGTNTEQGFQDYVKTDRYKALESSPIEQPEAQNYICLHCKEIFPYEPVMCNECGCKTFHKTEAKQPEAPQQEQLKNLTENEVAIFIQEANLKLFNDGKYVMMDYILDHKAIQITRKPL